MRKTLFFLAVTCTLFLSCTSKKPQEEDLAVPVSKSLFHNYDSIMYYAERAYKYEDPKGLFVMGVAARLRADGSLPDTIPTVPISEADIMLLRSAELGYPDAIKAIRCLDAHDRWHHTLPEWFNEK